MFSVFTLIGFNCSTTKVPDSSARDGVADRSGTSPEPRDCLRHQPSDARRRAEALRAPGPPPRGRHHLLALLERRGLEGGPRRVLFGVYNRLRDQVIEAFKVRPVSRAIHSLNERDFGDGT